MDELEGIILSKISQTRKDKCCMISHKESKKYNKPVNIMKKKQTHRYRKKKKKKKLVVTKGNGETA